MQRLQGYNTGSVFLSLHFTGHLQINLETTILHFLVDSECLKKKRTTFYTQLHQKRAAQRLGCYFLGGTPEKGQKEKGEWVCRAEMGLPLVPPGMQPDSWEPPRPPGG